MSATCQRRRALSTLDEGETGAAATSTYQAFKTFAAETLDSEAVRNADNAYVVECDNNRRFLTVAVDGVASIGSTALDALRSAFGQAAHLSYRDGTATATLPIHLQGTPIAVLEVAQWALWLASIGGTLWWLDGYTRAFGTAAAWVL